MVGGRCRRAVRRNASVRCWHPRPGAGRAGRRGCTVFVARPRRSCTWFTKSSFPDTSASGSIRCSRSMAWRRSAGRSPSAHRCSGCTPDSCCLPRGCWCSGGGRRVAGCGIAARRHRRRRFETGWRRRVVRLAVAGRVRGTGTVEELSSSPVEISISPRRVGRLLAAAIALLLAANCRTDRQVRLRPRSRLRTGAALLLRSRRKCPDLVFSHTAAPVRAGALEHRDADRSAGTPIRAALAVACRGLRVFVARRGCTNSRADRTAPSRALEPAQRRTRRSLDAAGGTPDVCVDAAGHSDHRRRVTVVRRLFQVAAPRDARPVRVRRDSSGDGRNLRGAAREHSTPRSSAHAKAAMPRW